MAKDAIGLYLESLKAHGGPVPSEDDGFLNSFTVPGTQH